ncbi:hypothetical protein EY643_16770 [Halioglobus maricola]|uniref:DUF4760 domain-containing protein n=1 Tax=Halioglobus maricola TaxID=2601894 RepID=A0A5P9NP09_9GAMM|nr:hypothetical protein [Halioglobus maricola]QFU77175.1 hypothetical protein EY643_16770 [Halioglobus maricola]
MKEDRYKWIAQVLAGLSVALSLLFVAYELKQSRDIAEAELTLSLYTLEHDSITDEIDWKYYHEAVAKRRDGEELNEREKYALRRYYGRDYGLVKSAYVLESNGLLLEGEWDYWLAVLDWQWDDPEFRRTHLPTEFNKSGNYSDFETELIKSYEKWQAENN